MLHPVQMRRPLLIVQDSFDLIHIRNLVQGIKDWSDLLSEAYRYPILPPGVPAP
jgi:hypothetical protein